MILDKVLLLKGLGGLTACAAVACTGTYIARPDLFESNDQTLVDLISKVGLTGCTNVNKECTIKTEGISVKQGDNKETSKTKQTASTGKIKVYKLEGDNTGYNEGFKFVIEEGDITLTGGSGSTTITKLEQFETYEIKKEDSGNDWYLTRKFTKAEAIKNALGLDGIDNCNFPTSDSDSSSCSEKEINAEKLKKINFDGKGTTDPTFPTGKSVKLTVSKENTTDTDFLYGYKFIFKTTGDVTIPKANDGGNITIKANIDTEFKIKKTGNKLTLEKAWTADSLAKKAGLTGCESSTKECSLPTTNTLNLYISESDKTPSVTIKSDSQSKKIKYSEDQESFNQGFKFYTEEEIVLTENSDKKIEASGTATYEIKKNSSDNKWYLTKKATSGGR